MPLIIDSNAVLTRAIAPEFLQAIARWPSQVLERLCGVDRDEFAEHDPPELRRKAFHGLSGELPFGVAVAEGLDHRG